MEKIAVVGMGFRYPDAVNKTELRKILAEGKTVEGKNAEERGKLLGIENYGKLTGNIRLLPDIDQFDNKFFGIVQPEAMEMPPEMRFSLVCGAEAIMDAGYCIEDMKHTRCGVVLAQSTNRYRDVLKRNSFLSFFNSMPGMTCGYLAHYLHLQGPAYHVDSTCSSSLTALANSCMHILMGSADKMLVGGVQFYLPLNERDGKDMASSVLSLGDHFCVPFDERANGFFNGEGVGFLLLERYSDAVRNGSPIYGVISGFGMSSNSDDMPTIYAPCAKAQSVAMREAWKMAGITADDITEFEAHGAATPQGDTAEMNSLASCTTDRTKDTPIYVTAVKSNLGHTSCAAGITSIIKVLLGFENKVIYPIANFVHASSSIDFKSAHAKPLGQLLHTGEAKRVADVASYGLNEMNVHIVLENSGERKSVKIPYCFENKSIWQKI